MERYGLQSNSAAEWSSPGFEEPAWQLGPSSGVELYPERPDEADCIYYLRTGFCGYGTRCRFNHPRDRGSVVGAFRAGGGEYPERANQPECQYYMRTGTCKFGTSCKYHHPRQGGGSVIPVSLNISGYPLRLGEKECSYYLRMGQCKFGVTCKFHHPQPAGIQVSAPLPLSVPTPAIYPSMQSPLVQSSQQYGLVAGNWPFPGPALVPGSYLQGAYGTMLIPPGMVPFAGWNPYQVEAPVSSAPSPSTLSTMGGASVYGIPQLSPSAPSYTGAYLPLPKSSQKEQMFPERPGQPECQHYMKTGDCKFGLSCRYHHPPEWSPPQINFALSPAGLPLRPGAPICTHYAQNRECKFGASCRFDHPMGTLSYSSSASSLADMPVAPYPVGSTVGTLAPSSSSSDLRQELISGSKKDDISARMSSSSSMTKSSSLIGSIFSDSMSATSQASAPSANPSSSTSHGGGLSKS
ncbi:hypothetical protein RHGRI_003281 [Rhododendron griersonianum]|uniref:C3H1-type domain-containing protein n=1 Tax=Rhododendron griersonianum TaxID=479676 RepID=A0AAV6L649_9ERIC|nr:hypothetical protein RHGRI_003281 [Rhododendron griersonianum]